MTFVAADTSASTEPPLKNNNSPPDLTNGTHKGISFESALTARAVA